MSLLVLFPLMYASAQSLPNVAMRINAKAIKSIMTDEAKPSFQEVLENNTRKTINVPKIRVAVIRYVCVICSVGLIEIGSF